MGLAAQPEEDMVFIGSTYMPPGQNGIELSPAGLRSLSMLCQEATGEEPMAPLPEFIYGIHAEVDNEDSPTGRYRRKRGNGTTIPCGEWPAHWVDGAHVFDGHDAHAQPKDREGEDWLIEESSSLYVQHGVEYAADDVSGAARDPAAVHKGRSVEVDYFRNMRVYDCVLRSEQAETGGPIIGTKWIDIHKSDADHPNIQCRLVGKEFCTTPDDALYACTPPFEALRLLMSRAATMGEDGRLREIIVNDVSRADFYAECTRPMYIEMPKEDPDADPSMLGQLRLCLYGTRDAAVNWQTTLSDHLGSGISQRGRTPFCVPPP